MIGFVKFCGFGCLVLAFGVSLALAVHPELGVALINHALEGRP